MAERSGGNEPPTCVSCREPLSNPGARFCTSCGAPQQEMRKCIVCGAQMLPGHQHCAFCGTDQNNPAVCVNPQCRRLLQPSMVFCYVCHTPKLQGSLRGHPPPGGFPTQEYQGGGWKMASMQYSSGPQGEPQVN